LLCAVLVILGAIWLANSADTIAEKTGLGRTFVGSVFLAFATSLPELVVTYSALKLNQLDLAIGNVFGSNMTNIFILFLCDVFHKGATIISTVSATHLLTIILSIILTYIAITGIRTKKKVVLGLGIDSLLMILFFFAGNMLLYSLR